MKIVKVLLSLPLFYVLYIGLYFIGDIVCGWLYFEIKPSYWLTIPPAIFCFAYLFTLAHACIIKWAKMNRYVYIISQILLVAWFTYLKYGSYLYYSNHDVGTFPEGMNSLIFNTEMVLSVVAFVLTFCISYFWRFVKPSTEISNERTKQQVAVFVLGAIFIAAAICVAILTIIEVYDPTSFWTKILSTVLLVSFWLELGVGVLLALGGVYGLIMKKLFGEDIQDVIG